MGKHKVRDKRLEQARKMPPMMKKHGDDQYCATEDGTLRWIAAQPTLQGYLFDLLARNGYITYDKDAGNWKGVDYRD